MARKAKPTPFGPRSPEHAQALADSVDWEKLLSDFDVAQVAMVPKDKDGKIVPRGEAGNPPPSKFVRAYWREMANLLAAADAQLAAGKRLPAGMATPLRALGRIATDLGAGIIPDPVGDSLSGRRGTSLDEMAQIRAAIIYVAVCRSEEGALETKDAEPVKIAADQFGVDEEAVYGWLRRFPIAEQEYARIDLPEAKEAMVRASAVYVRRVQGGTVADGVRKERGYVAQQPDAPETEEPARAQPLLRDELRGKLIAAGVKFHAGSPGE